MLTFPSITDAHFTYHPVEHPLQQSIPAHWTDHLAHLRPGERRALNSKIPIVSRINALEPVMKQLTDEELAALTPLLRQRHSKQPLFSLLPEAFAAIREASSRVLGMRHYDVQLLGGIVLAEGQIAEMATGEGKTLVAALPAYLYALTGKGCTWLLSMITWHNVMLRGLGKYWSLWGWGWGW